MNDTLIRFLCFAFVLQSGGVAGTSVDVALYPLDTIKTRLQSSQGASFACIYSLVCARVLLTAAALPKCVCMTCSNFAVQNALPNQAFLR